MGGDREKRDERGFLFEGTVRPPDADEVAATTPPRPRMHYEGHRARLRQRLASSGHESLADYELLEMVLFRSNTRGDTKPIAKALLKRFGTLAEVIGAPPHLLQEVQGVGPAAAQEIKLFAAIGERMLRSSLSRRQVLTSWSQVLDYCRAAMAFETREEFRILFLDKKNALLADEVQQTGTVDHTPVYPREVVRRALELSATAIILVHNHPSGDTTPSRADIEMTRTIVEAARQVGIAVHDHIIIGRDGHSSLKGLQLM